MAAAAPIHQSEAGPPNSGARAARHYAGTSFQKVLAHAFNAKVTSASVRPAVHHAAAHVWRPAHPAAPASASGALTQAMAAEGVPQSWQASLSFIMTKESGGRVGVQSPVHSARGLYQLTAANYHYNPHGAASFGNAVEEAQGGIRYIKQRYGSADKAAAFWRTHHWY